MRAARPWRARRHRAGPTLTLRPPRALLDSSWSTSSSSTWRGHGRRCSPLLRHLHPPSACALPPTDPRAGRSGSRGSVAPFTGSTRRGATVAATTTSPARRPPQRLYEDEHGNATCVNSRRAAADHPASFNQFMFLVARLQLHIVFVPWIAPSHSRISSHRRHRIAAVRPAGEGADVGVSTSPAGGGPPLLSGTVDVSGASERRPARGGDQPAVDVGAAMRWARVRSPSWGRRAKDGAPPAPPPRLLATPPLSGQTLR